MPRRHKGWKWEVLLRPVKAAPGSSARIRTHSTESGANAEVRRIKARLDVACPLERWRFEVGLIQDKSAVWGIWATYLGTMTPQERDEKVIRRMQHSKLVKAGLEKRKIKMALDPGQMTRPSPGRR